VEGKGVSQENEQTEKVLNKLISKNSHENFDIDKVKFIHSVTSFFGGQVFCFVGEIKFCLSIGHVLFVI
jgi:hypothetical protein